MNSVVSSEKLSFVTNHSLLSFPSGLNEICLFTIQFPKRILPFRHPILYLYDLAYIFLKRWDPLKPVACWGCHVTLIPIKQSLIDNWTETRGYWSQVSERVRCGIRKVIPDKRREGSNPSFSAKCMNPAIRCDCGIFL